MTTFHYILLMLLICIGLSYGQNIDFLKAAIKQRETAIGHCSVESTYDIEEPVFKHTEKGSLKIMIDDLACKLVVQPIGPTITPSTTCPAVSLTEVELGGFWYDYYPDLHAVVLDRRAASNAMFAFYLSDILKQTPYSMSTLSVIDDSKEFHFNENGEIWALHIVNKDGGIEDFLYDSSKGYLLNSFTYTNLGNELKVTCDNPILVNGVYFGKDWDLTLKIGGKLIRETKLEVLKLSLTEPFDKIAPPLVHGCKFQDNIDRSTSTIK